MIAPLHLRFGMGRRDATIGGAASEFT